MADPVAWSHQLVQPEIHQQLSELLHGEPDGFIQVGRKHFFFPKRFAEDGSKYCTFTPRPSDTWIVTFPRSGTTLTQELVWLLSNNSDYITAAETPLTERFPFLEFESCVNKKLLNQLLSAVENEQSKQLLLEVTGSAKESLDRFEGKRFIKTHLPFHLLHSDLLSCGAKVIYIARNPKDVAISYFHLHRLFKTLDFQGTFDQFWDLFSQNKLQWCPYWEHVNEAWDNRNNPNLLFLFYEDIKNDLISSIRKIDSFLGFKTKDTEIVKLAQHLEIRTFRNNSSVNFENLRGLGLLNDINQRFIRKGGESDQSKPDFSFELNKRADEWIEKNLKNTTLRFPTYL